MDVIKKLSLLMVLIICTGCGSTKPVGFDASGLDELKRLCEQDAGLKINKTDEAEGYYDASRKVGVLWHLISSDYRFAEYCNYDPNIASLFDEPGCWNMTKVSRESGQCDERVDKTLMGNGSDSSIEFRGKNCIAVEKIEKPTAQYSYHSDFKFWLAKNDTSRFTRSDVYIKDDLTNEVLGRYISYSYNIRPGHSTAKSCEIFEGSYPTYKEANLINSVLKSVSKGDIP